MQFPVHTYARILSTSAAVSYHSPPIAALPLLPPPVRLAEVAVDHSHRVWNYVRAIARVREKSVVITVRDATTAFAAVNAVGTATATGIIPT